MSSLVALGWDFVSFCDKPSAAPGFVLSNIFVEIWGSDTQRLPQGMRQDSNDNKMVATRARDFNKLSNRGLRKCV